MFTKVSVLVPTRGRVARLRTLLASYERTAPDPSELVFRVDDDDVEVQNFLLDYGGLRVVVGPRYHGYRSMPVFFNELFSCSTGDVLLCGNDDMVFRSQRWAQHILTAANAYTDGLFDLGVRTFNETHYPFSIVSRKAAECMGFLWDPRIFWGDIFLRDVMAVFGRSVMLPSVHIDHDWVGFRPDAVFAEADQQSLMVRDPGYWDGTHAHAVADAVEKLRVLRAGVVCDA